MKPEDLYENSEQVFHIGRIKEEIMKCFNYIQVKLEPIQADNKQIYRVIGEYI
jgi:hypothetical protein